MPKQKATYELSNFVHEVVKRYGSDPRNLVQILREVQGFYTHISRQAMRMIAQGLWLPQSQVEAVVGFYAFLSSTPRGRYDILLSDSITDHMSGKHELMAYLCEKLDVPPGQTRTDGLVSIDNTSCTGMCDQGPAGLINGQALTRLSMERADRIVELVENQVPLTRWPGEFFHVADNIRRTDRLLERDFSNGSGIKAVLARGPEAILAELKGSGLRGMGGAGFQTGMKWEFCRRAPADQRFVVCNADEGEPGTFKDRVLLQSYADLVFEGMTVCARVIGASAGYVYLRAEYSYLLEALREVLARRRRENLLGEHIMGSPDFSFDIDIHLGAGAYICGEESALIESQEGKRGVPRKRPPFPVTHGYLGKPTVVNNVETFGAAAKIAVRGADWYSAVGTSDSRGTKLISVSGDCERPGIYEFPFGTAVDAVLRACGAVDPQAVQMAGPSGQCVPKAEFGKGMSFEDLAPGGSFMIFSSERDMVEVARNFVGFFAHESCGFCTPCRVGTALMRDLVDKVYAGRGAAGDLDEMRALAYVMRSASHCGLGQTASNPVMDGLQNFADAWAKRLTPAEFQPAFDLDGALMTARKLTGRTDKEAYL